MYKVYKRSTSSLAQRTDEVLTTKSLNQAKEWIKRNAPMLENGQKYFIKLDGIQIFDSIAGENINIRFI